MRILQEMLTYIPRNEFTIACSSTQLSAFLCNPKQLPINRDIRGEQREAGLNSSTSLTPNSLQPTTNIKI